MKAVTINLNIRVNYPIKISSHWLKQLRQFCLRNMIQRVHSPNNFGKGNKFLSTMRNIDNQDEHCNILGNG